MAAELDYSKEISMCQYR